MSEGLLGVGFDIHGGGLDLLFPHHENEAAQTRRARGAELAALWMHNGMLAATDGEKMSKSLGNIALVHDILKTTPGEAVRLALLSAHYRQPLDWSDDLLGQTRRTLDRLYRALELAGDVPAAEVPAGEAPAGKVSAGKILAGKVPGGEYSSAYRRAKFRARGIGQSSELNFKSLHHQSKITGLAVSANHRSPRRCLPGRHWNIHGINGNL